MAAGSYGSSGSGPSSSAIRRALGSAKRSTTDLRRKDVGALQNHLVCPRSRNELRDLEQLAVEFEPGSTADLYTRPTHGAAPTDWL